MITVWAHLHLPRLQSGVTDVISVKVPGQRIDYASAIVLADPVFRVSEPGRQRCIRENVRNVHAWVVGIEVGRNRGSAAHDAPPEGFRRALYDPWKGDAFVDSETLERVVGARLAVLSGKNVYYSHGGVE